MQAQPNYVELEPNSRVSMYSNWKVVSEDCHPSRLSPKEGMSCYNSAYHDSTRVRTLVRYSSVEFIQRYVVRFGPS